VWIGMNRDEYARLKQIVAGALACPDAERSIFLSEHCGVDSTLRVEAESLLAAAVRAATLYEDPTLLVGGNPIPEDVLDDLAPPVAGLLLEPGVGHFTGTDRYVVRGQIGAGGMGVVYEVHDRVRDQPVALKTLRRRGGDDVYQLKGEFRALADVAHLNLVSLYDLVVDEGHCFFTMELVRGVTFVEHVRASTSSSERAHRIRRVLPQLIGGVAELHRRGLQHRDIKPSNVLVTVDGRVVILDFGLTSDRRRYGPAGGAAAGTPAYLSPEQSSGAEVSNASDWYSVGATLYHALAGRAPFEGPVRDVIHRKATEDPPPVSTLAPDTPADIVDVCMGLLQRDPAIRLTGNDVLRRLSAVAHGAESATAEPRDAVFIGRASPLAVLAAAFTDVTAARGTTVVIYGPSGIGKSALVHQFVAQLEHKRVIVFRGRCHEHESIPYKAFDGVIDGVTRHLNTLPAAERASVLPADAAALARLFPVVRAPEPELLAEDEPSDPVLLRRKALAAFRDLLGRLALRQPVVIDIDDFQWADADSIKWLTELLRPPAPASLLTVISFRSEELEAKPFLRDLIERVDIGERRAIALAPLPDREVTQLIDALRPHAGLSPAQCAEIADHGGGNPFLIEALTQHAGLDSGSAGATLEEMLTRRLQVLPEGSRTFLETLAVCGRPVLPARGFEACGFAGDERPLVARLRAARLLRNSRSADLVELYHDRIRETFASRVLPDAARQIHAALARVLVAHGDDDPEALFEHYRAAGDLARAAAQAAAAAAKASDVLAFDLAVTFYRHALDLQTADQQRVTWTVGLARALENAGRPVEAADAYLDVASRTPNVDHIEWRRKAAELLLIGGQIDRGLAVSTEVLAAVGMRLARGPRTAIASLACRRLQLRYRGLTFTPRDEAQIPADDLLRIDAAWAVSAGLAMVDPIRAAAFNVRQLLRALDVGDPYRIARAMALEAGFSVVGIGAGMRRSEAFLRRAETLAARDGYQYVAALTTLWSGIAAFLAGQWKKASDRCGRAATTLREECTGVTWELNMAHNFFLGGLVSQGELREAARHLPALLASARERGNFYLQLELDTRMILVWLASDDPDGADRRGDEGIARWSQRGFQRQHYSHMLMRVQTALYRGQARVAWRLMDGSSRALRRSQFLRVQHTRVEVANYRARCALAMAAAGEERDRMLQIARRDITRLEREKQPWSRAFARLLKATLAHLGGDLDAAEQALSAAAEAFSAADMNLYAAVCRHRLGALVGGDRGRQLCGAAERWMESQEIRNPGAMTRLIAPGLPDR
jgi:hypothetical protein